MHGTGTKLGDPIELEALATVFSEKTQRKQYCAIGSVKTNIGHTLAAAGLAGLQKVLFSMKDKKLVPSLHFEQPNEHFDFATSPFYVNTELQDWNPTAEGKPRRAAVSSFGFSGTNAHIVLEEYLSHSSGGQAQGTVPTASPSLFVLSAKSEQQLKSYAQEMNCWIQAHAEFALEDMAFTLQIGRDAMDYRLAILADSRETLLQRLETFVENQASTGVYTGQVKKSSSRAGSTRNDETLLEADEDEQSLHIWYQDKNLENIAQAWVKGVNIDWMQIYTSGRVGCTTPYRVSLPTYPFARERYWLPTTTRSAMTDGVIPTVGSAPSATTFAILHPLVQRNTSTLGKQRFSSTFDGQEFFLADHQVQGLRIMPAVAYLEMARAAIDLAIESSARKQGHILRLSQVEWIRP